MLIYIYLGERGKGGWGTSPLSPSPFQYNCGENGEMTPIPIPIPISIWG